MKSKSGQKRRQVALLVETSLASGRDILSGIARYVREHEAWSLYHEPRSLEESVPQWLRWWRGDGVIARVQTPAMAEAVRVMGLPVVDVLGVMSASKLPLVHVNDQEIGRLGAEHLLERGFRHFGYFGIEGENWSDHRREALASVVRAAGCDLQVYELPRGLAGISPWERMENDLAHWVAGLPKPAGVMVCSDQRGPQVLEACRRANVAVPDEVAVVGVDNDMPLCEVCNPPLSSINANHVAVGYEAAALLNQLMAGSPAPSQSVLVPPQGVVTRLSTDVLAVEDRKLALALRLIREQCHRPLGTAQLARQIGLSRSVLQRRFRQVLKRSVHEEIVAARLKRARELILETDLALGEIAERTGFKHQEYMGAVFRHRLKQTPGAVRRAARAGRAGLDPSKETP